ncbi:MAG: M23 family metallopeptidase [Bacteroidales bacterium]|nr:M23 family metallopeptidase [Bacteroidales bacterium]
MAKVKYQYNKNSLQYEKVPVTFKTRLLKFLSFIFTGIVFSAVIIFIAYNFFNSPKEKILKREIAQYKLQNEIINDRLDRISILLDDMQERDDNIYRVIFESEPISSTVRKAGYGGVNRYAKLEGYKNSEEIINITKKIDRISSQLYVQSNSFDEVYEMAKNKSEMLACIPAIQPVSNKNLKRLSSYYGYRTDPFYKVKKFHPGIDFSAPIGTEIYATGDGKVIEIKRSRRGYGNRLTIDHGYNYVTIYAHIDKFKVRKGQKVKRGQLVATVGNTGKSTAPHLHYEIRKNGKAINPIYYFFNDLTPEEYEKVLELSTRPSQTMD